MVPTRPILVSSKLQSHLHLLTFLDSRRTPYRNHNTARTEKVSLKGAFSLLVLISPVHRNIKFIQLYKCSRWVPSGVTRADKLCFMAIKNFFLWILFVFQYAVSRSLSSEKERRLWNEPFKIVPRILPASKVLGCNQRHCLVIESYPPALKKGATAWAPNGCQELHHL